MIVIMLVVVLVRVIVMDVRSVLVVVSHWIMVVHVRVFGARR